MAQSSGGLTPLFHPSPPSPRGCTRLSSFFFLTRSLLRPLSPHPSTSLLPEIPKQRRMSPALPQRAARGLRGFRLCCSCSPTEITALQPSLCLGCFPSPHEGQEASCSHLPETIPQPVPNPLKSAAYLVSLTGIRASLGSLFLHSRHMIHP